VKNPGLTWTARSGFEADQTPEIIQYFLQHRATCATDREPSPASALGRRCGTWGKVYKTEIPTSI